ncbi:MAG TPA: phosphoenolpyruvate carboxykinase (ATP) [Longimicrobiaceae bacterium]|nr:phosphoenolpyruvate carboxykinase (ATP) [Longimicrobiaceae bacterium]
MATEIEGQGETDTVSERPVAEGLEGHGLKPRGAVDWNLSAAELVQRAVIAGEGQLVEGGAFAAITAPHTGRSPNDRFIVRATGSEDEIWWGPVNRPMDPESYTRLRADLCASLEGKDLLVRDMWAGADEEYRISVRTITPSAWHNLFALNMFRLPERSALPFERPDFTILHDPDFNAEPDRHGTRSGAFIVLHLDRREVLIGGTRYAGEIKKSIVSVMNYFLPEHDALPMHCSANLGKEGDVAVFFGLSGTGKTTLSADPERDLIGDDEHGWSDDGVFNFEGGCYAKVIRLSPEREPEIFAASRRFGAILENVVVNEDHSVDLDSDAITENTRASYPLSFIPNFVPSGSAGHPRNIVFLAADAYGVLPPIARLTPEQAMYHFLSGYTAKLAGTERGVTEPKATFSACFGAPFLPRHPIVYAEMLRQRIERHQTRVWLVNTGWTGGPYGEGNRIELAHTRALLHAALDGRLDDVETKIEPVFGLAVPAAVPSVPTEVLNPRDTWRDPAAYDAQAARLAEMFRKNFAAFADQVSEEVRNAGPRVKG